MYTSTAYKLKASRSVLETSRLQKVTARPRDTRPQGVRTLEIHGF